MERFPSQYRDADSRRRPGLRAWAAGLVLCTGMLGQAAVAATAAAPISGEILHISLTTPGDYWSGGTIVIGGQSIILPRNLMIDLPANRLTLWQLVDQAPAACKALGQTGLAKGDSCNTSGRGAFAFVAANRMPSGNVIAGDMFLEKGRESVTGVVTYINHTDGYLRINGTPANPATPTVDPGTGLLARMNDPSSRHTIQQGLGCAAGNASNCSADPRFGLDPDNYTNVAVTGYPMCIPSRTARNWAGLPTQGTGPNASAAVSGGAAQLTAATDDALCPASNRPADPNTPATDSRRFAPIQVGDPIELEGNFETVNGVRFLSFHSSTTRVAIATKTALTQPDYIAPDEVELDAPGFNNLRIRGLFIGYSTLPPDILFWTVHYDPIENKPLEKPLGTTRGCDMVTRAGNDCTLNNGLVAGVGNHIWKLRYNLDFLEGARERANPCTHLRADARMGSGFCPNNLSQPAVAMNDVFGILSPLPREIIMRTGHLLAARAAGLEPVTVDIRGNKATNGEYLYPIGVGVEGLGGLGGIGFPEMVEVDLTKTALPFSFSAMPWTLDRRLSPGGCVGGCESTPQPLDPYPFEGIAMDPRTQAANIPIGPYNDPLFSAAPLTDVRNRILSYVTRVGTAEPAVYDFNGDASVLSWPPAEALPQELRPTPAVAFCAKGTGTATGNQSCVQPVAAPVCAPPLVLQNGACVRTPIQIAADEPAAPPVFSPATPGTPGTPPANPGQPANPPAPPVAHAVSIEAVVWVPIGGRRGLRVIAKTTTPADPGLQLFVSAFNTVEGPAFNGTPVLLPQTAMTRSTTPIATENGAVQCSVESPCWQLPLTRLPRNLKPTAVVVQSNRGATATATPTNNQSF